MTSFIMMKNIEVCKGFSILNIFLSFLSYTNSVVKIKTIEDYCEVLTSQCFFHSHYYENHHEHGN